jgi:hypothetical protein
MKNSQTNFGAGKAGSEKAGAQRQERKKAGGLLINKLPALFY